MKKEISIVVLILSFATISFGQGSQIVVPYTVDHVRTDPGRLHTDRNEWQIIDSTTSSGDEPNDLAVTERTYASVVAAAEGGDAEISIFDIPRSWNGIRLRALGITDGGTATYQIYLGTLGDGNLDSGSTGADCELAYVGQLAFIIGQQSSIYSQVAYTSGGTRTPVPGETFTGNTSGETAILISDSITSGTYADANAVGTYTVRTQTGTFQSETLNLTTLSGGSITNVATISADMVRFELADTLTITESDWTADWASSSPVGNRVAEGLLDLNGADVLIAVATTITADSKLIGKGF